MAESLEEPGGLVIGAHPNLLGLNLYSIFAI
jgi:hypothetical protein